MRLVVIVGDLHINSTVALCPPRFTLDDGGSYVASQQQQFIWRHWIKFWDEIADVKRAHKNVDTYVIINGELADDLNHRSTQLITKNPADQLRLALAALKPLLGVVDRIFVTRGTEAHSGPSGSIDELIAADIGAIQDAYGNYAWWNFIGELGGVLFDVAHHPGHGHARPWTRGADANRLAADIIYRYVEHPDRLRIPDLIIRSHTHKKSDSYDNHPARAIMIPSWQLTNAFGHRLGGGWLPIGGIYTLCDSGSYGEIQKRYLQWPIKREIWTEKNLRTVN